MASTSFSEEDFSCPVCFDIYTDPVLLMCSHSACKTCLQHFWTAKMSRECPVCRSVSSLKKCPPNLALKNLCETFLQKKSEVAARLICRLHGEKLKLFCLEDKQTVCLVCRDSKNHSSHHFSPIDEAAQERKEEQRIKLQPLEKKLETFKQAKKSCDETAQHITALSQSTERQMKKEFEKLHQFLRDEEAARIAVLREEERQKISMMKHEEEKMGQEISSLTDTIRTVKEEIGADDIIFLQNYKHTVERAQCTQQDPERVSGALINVAKHLGNLKFRVWEKMLGIVQFTPVTLDPNTANSQLMLSEDLTSMKHGKEQQLPDNPERFDKWISVLGSEGFSSGTHYWDVEFRDSEHWDLGVVSEYCQRKGMRFPQSEFWSVFYYNGIYAALSPGQPSFQLSLRHKLQRIRVQLDWDGGQLSFFDPDNNTSLVTFTHNFTERVFPYFAAYSLKILPVEVAITAVPTSWI